MDRESIAGFVWLNQDVRAFLASDRNATHARGRVVAYCDAPTVLIETEDGERVDWRADLCEITVSPLDTTVSPLDTNKRDRG